MQGTRKEAGKYQHVRSVDLPCDPDAKRGVCHSPWCNNWIENMRGDNRCHNPECDRRLWEEALARGLAFYTDDGTLIGTVVPLLVKEKFIPVPPENLDRIDGEIRECDICPFCSKNLCRPGDNRCNECYRLEQTRRYEEYKAQGKRRRNHIQESRKGKYRERKINKIRGLGGIILQEEDNG